MDFDLVDLSIINDKNKISIINTSIKQYLKSLIDEIKQKIKLDLTLDISLEFKNKILATIRQKKETN